MRHQLWHGQFALYSNLLLLTLKFTSGHDTLLDATEKAPGQWLLKARAHSRD